MNFAAGTDELRRQEIARLADHLTAILEGRPGRASSG
jgi:hypothetical protein